MGTVSLSLFSMQFLTIQQGGLYRITKPLFPLKTVHTTACDHPFILILFHSRFLLSLWSPFSWPSNHHKHSFLHSFNNYPFPQSIPLQNFFHILVCAPFICRPGGPGAVHMEPGDHTGPWVANTCISGMVSHAGSSGY